MDELLSEFLVESQKRLSALDAVLAKFPSDPGNAAAREQIFDFLHTIKGTSVLLGLGRLEAIAQAGETLLAKMGDESVVPSAESAALVLEAIESIRRIQRTIATSGQEPSGNDSRLLADLKAGASVRRTPRAAPSTTPESVPPPQPKPRLRVTADAMPLPVAAVVPEPAPPVQPSLSIPLERVARITSLVGDLVAARNSLNHVLRDRMDETLEGPLQRLDHVTSDLSAAVMAARKQVGYALPSSFEILRVVSVDCGGQRYAIPQRSVLELVRLVPGARRVPSDDYRVLRLRERQHPWVRLASLLGVREPPRLPGTRELIVMLEGLDGPFGLAVDRIYDIEEIVVRPLPPVLGGIPIFTGSALTGDSSVALVLDPGTLATAMQHRRIAPARTQLEKQ